MIFILQVVYLSIFYVWYSSNHDFAVCDLLPFIASFMQMFTPSLLVFAHDFIKLKKNVLAAEDLLEYHSQ